jgi:hypothetical protein
MLGGLAAMRRARRVGINGLWEGFHLVLDVHPEATRRSVSVKGGAHSSGRRGSGIEGTRRSVDSGYMNCSTRSVNTG